MNQNKLTFESEGLTVDYVTFNFEQLNESRKAHLISYFYKLGFNSYDTDRKYRNAFDESIKYNSKNLYQIRFIKNITPHWKGIAVAFSDDSGAYFYKLAKNNEIQWDLFDLAILSRFDLNYLRPLQSDEVHSVTQFLRTSQEEIRRKRINAKLEGSLNQQILKIASRRSSRCARIYTTDNSLKFEIELRNNFIKNCNYLLVEDCFEELESKLVEQYISYFGKLLPFQYLYTDWLAEKLRPFRVNLKTYSKPTLCSDYIHIEPETMLGSLEQKKFIMFLKFLKFTTSLDYKTDIFDGDSYRIIIFRVKDFLDVSHSHYNSQNEYYKMQKTRDFFRDLQQNLFMRCFTDDYFKSLVTIPKIEVYKCKKSKCWLTRILLLEQLFDYQYPFKYPDLFETESIKLNRDQYLVRFQFIRVFSSKNATKNFYLREFFQQHPVSNKRNRDIKRIFIELTQEFYQFGLIDSKVKLMLHNYYINIENLTTFNISDGFILYEKIVSK
ncbi:unnamed protein product [Ectocarpus fasciculatus]